MIIILIAGESPSPHFHPPPSCSLLPLSRYLWPAESDSFISHDCFPMKRVVPSGSFREGGSTVNYTITPQRAPGTGADINKYTEDRLYILMALIACQTDAKAVRPPTCFSLNLTVLNILKRQETANKSAGVFYPWHDKKYDRNSVPDSRNTHIDLSLDNLLKPTFLCVCVCVCFEYNFLSLLGFCYRLHVDH